MAFLFQFVYTVDYTGGFSYVEPSLNSWDKAKLIMVDDFSDVILDSIRQYFVDYLYVNIHGGCWSVILFFRFVFVWHGYQGNL